MTSNTDFLYNLKNNCSNISKNSLQRQISKLLVTVKLNGLPTENQIIIVDVLISVNLDVEIFQNLILCLIPQETVSDEIIRNVLSWIIRVYKNENYTKIESLLIWIASLLDYHLVNWSIVNKFYNLIGCLLEMFPKCVSHILYLLTKPYDVVLWRVNKVQELIQNYGPKPYLCLLLNQFKEKNSKFAHLSIPPYRKTEKIFSYKTRFYKDLRNALGRFKTKDNATTVGSIIIPYTKRQKIIKNKNEILPTFQYLDKEFEIFAVESYVHNISTGTELFRNFHTIKLPSHTLSLIKSSMGLRILMFSDLDIQEHFICNLHAVLVQSFIYHKNSNVEEMQNLLNSVVQLHWFYQQGFLKISNFLSLYLQFWNGLAYKNEIYKLLEWFVFTSFTELNKFLLKPLYTLFISSCPNEMCDIILCLTNLIINLYFMMAKKERRIPNLIEEKVLMSSEELVPVLKSLSKFVSELCKLGLYSYPCDNEILITAIMFYEKVYYLERLYDLPFWTTVSSNVLYHSLLGFNAQILNQVCSIILNYPGSISSSTPKMEEKISKLQNYVQDIYNFLWSSNAFQDRMSGHILRGLSREDSISWRSYVNLNNSLDIMRHVMFEPYRYLELKRLKNVKKNGAKSKEKMLEILKSHVPYIVDFIETFRTMEEKQTDMVSYSYCT